MNENIIKWTSCMFLSEDYKPNKTVTILSLLVLGIAVSFALYFGIKNRLALSGEVRYTIAYTNEIIITSSGRAVKYSYTVSGKGYKDVATYAFNSRVPGGRYLVKFSVEYPEINELYQNKPIPPTINEAPTEGWENRELGIE